MPSAKQADDAKRRRNLAMRQRVDSDMDGVAPERETVVCPGMRKRISVAVDVGLSHFQALCR